MLGFLHSVQGVPLWPPVLQANGRSQGHVPTLFLGLSINKRKISNFSATCYAAQSRYCLAEQFLHRMPDFADKARSIKRHAISRRAKAVFQGKQLLESAVRGRFGE